jgi:enamine deaminase RidA (YjgF/YER057c/UK114 family)
MKTSDVVLPAEMQETHDTYHYSPAVRDGNRLFLSGQIGYGPDGTPAKDPETQFKQAFDLIKVTLTAAGVSFADVVELVSYHVGLREHLDTFVKVKDLYLKYPYPTWTAIGITELGLPGALVEVKVTVSLPGPAK